MKQDTDGDGINDDVEGKNSETKYIFFNNPLKKEEVLPATCLSEPTALHQGSPYYDSIIITNLVQKAKIDNDNLSCNGIYVTDDCAIGVFTDFNMYEKPNSDGNINYYVYKFWYENKSFDQWGEYCDKFSWYVNFFKPTLDFF